MEWIEFTGCKYLKEGTICKTYEGNFVIVGGINTSMGLNDEFTEDITHYTEHFVDDVKEILNKAKLDFESNANGEICERQ